MRGLVENLIHANLRLREVVIKFAQSNDDLFRDGLIQEIAERITALYAHEFEKLIKVLRQEYIT
ncbi:hypothetical protein SCACP_31890 [Sporomusa carbonis]|uniref:hypothetical protein n=1 Tax=Sporomusa carbonis TaxID=3076075 RepID=UPI003A63FE32